MWIPRGVYEALPALYAMAGAVLLALPFLSEALPATLLLVLGGLCLTAGLVLWMHRRSYRANQAEYEGRPLDE
jgi:hypothetical protein